MLCKDISPPSMFSVDERKQALEAVITKTILLQMSITHHPSFCKGPGQQCWLSLPRDSNSLGSMPCHPPNPMQFYVCRKKYSIQSVGFCLFILTAQFSHELGWQERSSEFVCLACNKRASVRVCKSRRFLYYVLYSTTPAIPVPLQDGMQVGTRLET